MLETANVMFTDTVDSTSTLTRIGADAAEAQRRRHDTIVANVVTVFGGRVVKSTGDGALALLPSADHLVRAGSAVQEAAAAEGIPLRVGVSTGDVVSEHGDCFGEAVVVASRLCAHGQPGSVLVDAATVVVRGRRRDPPLERLAEQSLKGFDEPREIWTVAPTAVAGRRVADAVEPVYGREAETARIESAWASAAGPSLVVLVGEPGIGKTHLATAVAGRGGEPLVVRFDATERDGLAVWGAALDAWVSDIPVGVVAALGPEVVSRITALLPSIGTHLRVDAGEHPADAGREAMFDALAAVVQVVGRGRTIVLDDVQWAGGTSHAFVARLVASTERLQLLATCRLPLPGAIQSLASTIVPLNGLADEALGELLRSRGVASIDVKAATERAGGNPLLALVASESTARGGGDPVAERFLALPAEQLEVMGVAGLVGRTIDVALLSELTGTPAPELAVGLDAAVRGGLLADDGSTLAFVHDVVREAAAATLPAHRRTALHAAAATALLRRRDTVTAIHHALDGFGALEPDDAVEAVARGCEELAQRLAFEEMLAVATRLSEIVAADHRCGPRHEAAALLMTSWAYQLLGDVPRQQETALAAGRRARVDGAYVLLAQAALSRAGSGPAGEPDPDTAELLDSALALVPTDDLAERSSLLGMRAFYLLNYEGRGVEARSASLDALTIARQSGDLEVLADALSGRLFVLLAGSDVLEQLAAAEELRGLVTRLPPSRAGEVWAGLHRNLGVLRLQLGDRGGFTVCHDEVRSLGRQTHNWLLSAIATMWDGVVALLDGDLDLAEQRATAIAAYGDEQNLVASEAAQLAAVHRWRGTLDTIVTEVREQAAAQPRQPLGSSVTAIVETLAGDGRAGGTLDAVLRRSPALVDDSTLAAQLAALTEACALVGRDIPDAVVTGLQPFAGQLLVLSWGVDVLGAADRFLAVAAARSGDRAAAAAGFDRAAQLEARVSSTLPLRTQVWRHVLLGDVPEPEIPSALAGLAAEAKALRGREL
jgi:class 3 adenylate cyclase